MEYDYLKIRSKANELEKHTGYLPWIIQRKIDLDNYHNNLEKKGLYDKFKDKLSESMMFLIKNIKKSLYNGLLLIQNILNF